MSAVSFGMKILKIGMSYITEKSFAQDVLGEFTTLGIEKVESFIKTYVSDINHLLSLEDEEMKRQNIPQEKRHDIRNNIKEFILTVNLDEIAKDCLYDETKLGEALSNRYKEEYAQESETDFKYYQRMLYSLANYALDTIKNSKNFERARILDCYTLLVTIQQQQNQDHIAHAKISEQLEKLIKCFTNQGTTEENLPRIFTTLAPRPPETTHLVSRKDLHEKILGLIAQKKKRILVHGIGGIGKSTICKDLFHELLETTELPLGWINYNGTSLEEDFITQFFYPVDETERKKKIKYFLHNEIDENAIFFIDNLNATSSEDPFIEVLTNAKCNIICTSRSTKYAYFTLVPIDFLTPEDCVLLFEKYAHTKYGTNENENHNKKSAIYSIINKVARHTLTIEILGKIAYCEELTPEEILKQLEVNGIDLEGIAEMNLDEDTLTGHLAKIFSVEELDLDKKYILAHFANCPMEQIPKDIRKWIHFSKNYPIKYLMTHGWFVENELSYYMHPIIKETVKRNCKLEYQDYVPLINSLSSLSMYDRNMGIKKALPYFSYMQSVLENVKDEVNPDIAWICFNLGWMSRLLGDFSKAIAYFEKAIRQWSHPDMLYADNLYDKCSLTDMASLNEEVKNFPLPEQDAKKLSIYVYSRIVNLYVQIGTCYQNLGETEKARNWYDKIQQYKGLYWDPELDAQIYNNYALTYQTDYRNEKATNPHSPLLDTIKQNAIENFERTIREFRALQKNDEFMALAIRNAGAFYLECGEIQTAITYFEDALEIRDPILDAHSPDRERNYFDLGTAFHLLGDQQTMPAEQKESYKTAYHYYTLCHKIALVNAEDKINKVALAVLEQEMERCLKQIQP